MRILLGVFLAVLYWFLSTGGVRGIPVWVMALPKWLAAMVTHSHPLAPMDLAYTSLCLHLDELQHLFKWATITAYSIGDVVLLYDEPYALPFFGIGHMAFVVTVSAHDLIPGIVAMMPGVSRCGLFSGKPLIVMYYVGLAHIFAVITAIVVLCLWVLRNGCRLRTILFYAVYMYSLALALFVGLCYYERGVGIILFVLSDVIIGFRLDSFRVMTYPLYYGSLLVLYFTV